MLGNEKDFLSRILTRRATPAQHPPAPPIVLKSRQAQGKEFNNDVRIGALKKYL
jgi:hypothetical protein